MELRHLVSLLGALYLFASTISAQNTTLPLFVGAYPPFSTSAVLAGSVIAANPTATTYTLSCSNYLFLNSFPCDNGVALTAGPSWQALTIADKDSAMHMSCTFTGTTAAFCIETHAANAATAVPTIGRVAYVPPGITSGIASLFPGFQSMVITAGVEKLVAASTASAMADSASQTQVVSSIQMSAATVTAGGMGPVAPPTSQTPPVNSQTTKSVSTSAACSGDRISGVYTMVFLLWAMLSATVAAL